MTDEPAEDRLAAEVAIALGQACGRPPSDSLAGSISIPARTAAAIVVSRMRAAGISDLVIARALVDEGWEKKEAAQAGC